MSGMSERIIMMITLTDLWVLLWRAKMMVVVVAESVAF